MIRWFDGYNNDGDDHEFTMTWMMQIYNRNKPWWLDDDHDSAVMMMKMVKDDNLYCFGFFVIFHVPCTPNLLALDF